MLSNLKLLFVLLGLYEIRDKLNHDASTAATSLDEKIDAPTVNNVDHCDENASSVNNVHHFDETVSGENIISQRTSIVPSHFYQLNYQLYEQNYPLPNAPTEKDLSQQIEGIFISKCI